MARIQIKDLEQKVKELDDDYKVIQDVINNTVLEYTKNIDSLLTNIRNAINDVKYPITNEDLEQITLKLPVELFYLNTAVETAGIKLDLSNQLKESLYNTYYNEISGTAKERDIYATEKLEENNLVNSIYKRVYNILRNKIDSAYELLSSVKKVLTKRMAEINSNLDRETINE